MRNKINKFSLNKYFSKRYNKSLLYINTIGQICLYKTLIIIE